MSFLKRWDESLDKLFAPKIDLLKVLETNIFNKIKSDGLILEERLTILEGTIANGLQKVEEDLQDLILRVEKVEKALSTIPESEALKIKEIITRVEKVELYTGLTRKVDPTKQNLLKNAFEM